jgi:hypothetical protein
MDEFSDYEREAEAKIKALEKEVESLNESIDNANAEREHHG